MHIILSFSLSLGPGPPLSSLSLRNVRTEVSLFLSFLSFSQTCRNTSFPFFPVLRINTGGERRSQKWLRNREEKSRKRTEESGN